MSMIRRLKVTFIIGILGFASALEAVIPRQWELRTKDDFLKGKLEGISVSFEGLLSLGPKEDNLEGPAEDFYLSFVLGPDGVGYLGTGHGGKIFRVGKDGKAELYFQAQEMDVTCLAMDEKGVLYAGTSPNGKVYKITGKDQGTAFFNPEEKYVWDLAFTDDGFLMAAVGEAGGIYKINLQGEGQRVLKAEENHVLCLQKTREGDFIAGSGGVGVIYRLGADGRTTVLFESPFEEIKSLALDSDGNIYAACGGTPSRTRKEESPEPAVRLAAEVTVTASAAAPSSAAAASPAAVSSGKEPSALFRVRPDGIAKKLWESDDELIYSLLWRGEEKKLLFGTGSRGRIYAVDSDEKVSLLTQSASEQIYSLVPADTRVYALADNPSRLTVLSPERRSSAEYVSDVLDTRTVSAWGRLEYDGQLLAGTTIQLQTRSGNSFEPNGMWSDWSPPIQKKEEPILSPKARYLQFKILFRTQAGNVSPTLQRVSLFYLQANIAPVIQKLDLLPPNEVYLKPPEQEEVIWGAEESAGGRERAAKEDQSLYAAKKVERQGFQTITWEATDENEDRLLSTISIRKEGEDVWRVVKDGLSDSLFAFNTVSYPDGVYFIKLSASDLGSNPPGSELRAEKTSSPLVIDNSLPVIQGLSAVRAGNSLDVAFQAEDSFSSIREAQYLIRPGEWRVIFPTDGICDSRAESFKVRLPLAAGSENLIIVRVIDGHGNVGVYRQTF